MINITKSGFYVFMELDVIGYTVLKIYKNDKYLIPDIRKNYEVEGIDYKEKFLRNESEVIDYCLYMINEHGLGVRDYTKKFMDENYHMVDESLKCFENLKKENEVKKNE